MSAAGDALYSAPPELRAIGPFLQRAQELKDREPVINYYCIYYALKLALELKLRTPDAQQYLLNLMDHLEVQKKALAADKEAVANDLVGYAHVENFALRIFMAADNEDRAGRASRKTAKAFLAASIFLEILRVFKELDDETTEKIRYAKWKAADIAKALKEGRAPVPGPAGGLDPAESPDALGHHHRQHPADNNDDDDDGALGDDAAAPRHPEHAGILPFGGALMPSPDGAAGDDSPTASVPGSPLPRPPSALAPYPVASPSAPPMGVAAGASPLSPGAPSPAAAKAAAAKPMSPTRYMAAQAAATGPSFQEAFAINYKDVNEAQKLAKFAISAIQFDDFDEAVRNLEHALLLIRPYVGRGPKKSSGAVF